MTRYALCCLLLLTMGCTSAPRTRPAVASFGHDVPEAGPARSSMLPAAQADPIVTDGDKYRVVLENERVRVLRYEDEPGAKTNAHHHPEFVLYALSDFRRRLTFPDGSVKERTFRAGEVIWMPEQTHVGQNTGTTATDVVIVEIKRP